MADKTLEIIMKVRDLASQPIKAIGMAMGGLRDKLNDTGARGGGVGTADKSLEDLRKIVRIFAVIETGAKSATAAIDGLGAAFSYTRGDIDGAHARMDKFQAGLAELPFGIGAANQLGRAIRGIFTGNEQDELDKINASLHAMELRAKDLTAAYIAMVAAKKQSGGMGQSAIDTLDTLQLDPEQRAIKQVEIEARNKTQEIERLRLANEQRLRATNVSESVIAKASAPFNLDFDRVMMEKDAKIAELRRLAAEKLAAFDKDAERNRLNIIAESGEEELRQRGDALGAQVVQLRKSYVDQAQAIQEGVEKQNKDPFLLPETKSRLVEQGNQQIAALAEQLKIKISGLERDTYTERGRIVADGEAALADMQSEARERRLQAEGKTLDATLERIKRSYDDQGNAIVKALENQLKNLPDGGEEEKKLRANAAERIKLLKEGRNLEEKQAALMDKQKSPRTELGNFRLREGRMLGGDARAAIRLGIGAAAGGGAGGGGTFGETDPLVAAQQRALSEAARAADNTGKSNDILEQILEAVKGTQLEPMNP